MIGQILGSLGGLAKSYIDAKTTVKIPEAEIKKKQVSGEIDWEQSSIEVSKDGRMDDYALHIMPKSNTLFSAQGCCRIFWCIVQNLCILQI